MPWHACGGQRTPFLFPFHHVGSQRLLYLSFSSRHPYPLSNFTGFGQRFLCIIEPCGANLTGCRIAKDEKPLEVPRKDCFNLDGPWVCLQGIILIWITEFGRWAECSIPPPCFLIAESVGPAVSSFCPCGLSRPREPREMLPPFSAFITAFHHSSRKS